MPTALVVDDNADTRAVVRWMLEQRGCRVLEAGDGREAVEAVGESRPDLVLLDYRYEDGTGEELCRLIRRSDRHTPILFF